MNELIKITKTENGLVSSARDLHIALKVKTEFSKWCKRMFEYGFIENQDYTLVKIGEGNAHNKTDYAITSDTAKEIAMLQRSEVGKQIRQYYIEYEKTHNTKSLIIPSYQIENPAERARAWAVEYEEKLLLVEKNEKLQFRSDFVDVCFDTDGVFSMEEVCKIIKLPYGRNTMLQKLRDLNIFLKSNTPNQKFISNGYFKVVEQLIDTNKFKKLVSTTYATQKGLAYIHKILIENGK